MCFPDYNFANFQKDFVHYTDYDSFKKETLQQSECEKVLQLTVNLCEELTWKKKRTPFLNCLILRYSKNDVSKRWGWGVGKAFPI